ncbi:conserved exported hypothetical protein [Bradyrhizobium sp. STM 3843]|uniref:DUF2380 domain-containing protein n=1 Tax=Bradyrhizobium sp. STM 3843 TaxID=551947 RepID=UPI0002404F71|nr:DUF2380 domain-containing protein [Bradyrhizobium sp. STM 3843]CCE08098.1 conserved exported hypothetical protein [Bradyrhizobium sp. STM 3843]
MTRSSRLLGRFAIASLMFAVGFGRAWPAQPSGPAPAVVVADFSYVDTSGEPADQSAAHQRRLQAFMAALRHELATDQRLRLVDPSCAPSCLADGTAMDGLRRVTTDAGARFLVVGAVQKTSTLVQWARTAVVEVASNRVISEKLFTFRGDDDEAWQRAEIFISRQIRDAMAAPSAPVRIALLPFTLDDSSAGAGAVGATETDIKGLADTTEAVRQLLDQSGRYRLVEVDTAVAAKPQTGCDDCDLRFARELGADQALTGVVGRVSRTEYTIRFQLRDTRSGAVIAAGDSGLRMGANYSWGRGAARLVSERLLGGDETR